MESEKSQRHAFAAYIVVGLIGIIGLFASYSWAKNRDVRDILFSISSELLVVAVIFFLVDRFFMVRPDEERIAKLDAKLDETESKLSATTDILQNRLTEVISKVP